METTGKSQSESNRKLGDEWLNWDGKQESTEADYRLFVWISVLAGGVVLTGGAVFLWLIWPRLAQFGGYVPLIVTALMIGLGILTLGWVVLFAWSAAVGRPIAAFILRPSIVNRLLGLVEKIGKMMGISTDRLTNSFLKTHNILVGSNPKQIAPEKLLVLAPRCLAKDSNNRLRRLRDQYRFELAVVGGGSDARQKIRQLRPLMVVAIACERDLLSGFKEVNPSIPVIGLPNLRPEGPCKNTCIDLAQLEQTIKRCLLPSHTGPAAELT
ncbi:MAG: DUF116 domain-containing protein [bacterium]